MTLEKLKQFRTGVYLEFRLKAQAQKKVLRELEIKNRQ